MENNMKRKERKRITMAESVGNVFNVVICNMQQALQQLKGAVYMNYLLCIG
jgi:hypothetical protein